MARYPGGTLLDHNTKGYSLSQNFLSDLGMTVAYDGQDNLLGAALLALSVMFLVLGPGASTFALARICGDSSGAKWWGRASAFVSASACVAFLGVALTPENRVLALHLRLTYLAWELVAAASMLMSIASAMTRVCPRSIKLSWGVLAAAMLGYVGILYAGPGVETLDGLRTQVIAQKAATVIVVAMVVYLGGEGERVVRQRRREAGSVRFDG